VTIKKIIIYFIITILVGFVIRFARINILPNHLEEPSAYSKTGFIKVTILGNIKSPGTYKVPIWTSLKYLITLAGGTKTNRNNNFAGNWNFTVSDKEIIHLRSNKTFYIK
jgi:hypothetical protein